MKFPKLPRMPELDALRGLFLVWMTLTHLPTHFSDLVNQPFGFISSAEGFVFLSALLVARLYIRQDAEVRRPLDRAICNGGQTHSYDRAGVARIDHAVVIQHPGQHQG